MKGSKSKKSRKEEVKELSVSSPIVSSVNTDMGTQLSSTSSVASSAASSAAAPSGKDEDAATSVPPLASPASATLPKAVSLPNLDAAAPPPPPPPPPVVTVSKAAAPQSDFLAQLGEAKLKKSQSAPTVLLKAENPNDATAAFSKGFDMIRSKKAKTSQGKKLKTAKTYDPDWDD
jgi:hypothetical protein